MYLPFLLVAFLFPPAVYTLVLGLLNRRRAPLMVPGTWDFAGVVFAASGFLLAGGLFVLTMLNKQWQWFWLSGQRRYLQEVEGGRQLLPWLIAGYFCLVVLGVALQIWRRRLVTVVYNVEPKVFDEALAQVLEDKGWSWNRAGNLVFIAEPSAPPISLSRPPQGDGLGPTQAGRVGQQAVLDVDASPALRSATLRWRLYSDLALWSIRQELEAGLQRELANRQTWHNPVGGWLLTVSASLFLLVLLALVFLVLFETVRAGS